jgi:exodeoxyribonuclease-5
MWNNQQSDALNAVNVWLREWHMTRKSSNQQQIFRLFGYAGTGKSTLARHFAENVDGDTCFAAFTGKAALVMRKAGCVGARTIHSLIYIAEQDNKTGEVTFRINKQSSLSSAALLIIDECSMVNAEIAKDLMSFGKPILVLGDPAQLPPVDGAGYFTNSSPDIMLTEIHRQAKDNPIIHLATLARNGQPLDIGSYGDSKVVQKISSKDALDANQILVGRNVTREDMNRKMRKMLKFSDDKPMPNEKMICLKNDKDLAIFNGGMFTVLEQMQSKYNTKFSRYMVQSDDEDRAPIIMKIHDSFFVPDVPIPHWKMLKGSQSVDFSYCITTHKAQGSQWDNVLIYDESYCFRDDSPRWIYTAITRASERVTIVK